MSEGEALAKFVVYTSDQAHDCINKACQIVGISTTNLCVIEADASTNYSMVPALLAKTVTADVAAGLISFFLFGTVGSTSSAAMDPISELGDIAKAYAMWFHVDGAYAGNACICPEYRQPSDEHLVVDFKDWQIPLGRRFRSLKLWMVMRLYGISGLQSHIRKGCELAKHFKGLAHADPRFEILARAYTLRFAIGGTLTELQHGKSFKIKHPSF